ncbi:hypothetical protein T03_669 [Trichinella britovi]|uniref:Uncharacterized protein n=1 Tax=Trichinella britovi TaxID=45882 RepID=A0A0V1CHJ1_TRIBR|nr:hypothetical protein T03_669 [Trichinella britovi]KRZ84728.1 hypothetical protein T08_7567 [Trichinella sp. T8]
MKFSSPLRAAVSVSLSVVRLVEHRRLVDLSARRWKTDHVGGDQIARMKRQHFHHQNTVDSQMVERERMQILLNHRPALSVVVCVHHFRVSGDKSQQGPFGKNQRHPAQHIASRRRSDEHQPPPQEQKRPLVEHVDHQNALDTVPVQVAQQAYFEIAQRHTGKMARPLPLVSVDQIDQYRHTPELIFRRQKPIEQKQLTDGVDQICKFDTQIQHCDSITMFESWIIFCMAILQLNTIFDVIGDRLDEFSSTINKTFVHQIANLAGARLSKVNKTRPLEWPTQTAPTDSSQFEARIYR